MTMRKMQVMHDWSELRHDLLVLIVRNLNLIEDYLNFRTVCKSWHSVATKDNFNSNLPKVPWLMLAEEEDDDTCRKFFSLYNGMILKKSIPKARGKRCMESMGWLITVGKDKGEISLLHPFSGVQIELPHQNTSTLHDHTEEPWTFIKKAVLSDNPSHTSNYILMVIAGPYNLLSFWRSGDLLWTRMREQVEFPYLNDAVYFSGQFYVISCRGCIQVCDVTGPRPTKCRIVMHMDDQHSELFYILESLGSLFVVAQSSDEISDSGDDNEVLTHGTTYFYVYQVNLAARKVTQTWDLGDRAFFLGASASISVEASQFPGIKSNHIYFTDNYVDAYIHLEEGGSLNMGVFNIANGSIEPHYDGVSLSRVCPPIWVTPTLC